MGVFINFRDFKGKIEDALAKLLNDMKKYGIPNIKSLKVDSLKSGYGEIVCQLINELINIELYRRDFEFHPPEFMDDDQDESDVESGGDDDRFRGDSEVINGIEIQTYAQGD